MGTALFTNNAYSTLASGITDVATTATVAAGEGTRYPSPTGGDFFYATLIDTSNNLEIIKCTARSTDTLTIVRAQESTTGRAYSAGDRIELRVTAAGLTETVTASAASAAAAATSETNAATSESNADADATATAADVVTTNADVVTTNADVVSTNADVVTTTQDAIDTAADVVSTNADVVSTNADVVSTNADVVTSTGEASAAQPKFTFSTTTTMADPGVGILRYNNATVASVTAIAIDDTTADAGNPDIAAWIVSWDDSSSTVKGYLRIVEPGTPANYAVFNITGLTDNAGWTELAVTHVDSNSTFADTASIRVMFSRTGDIGATGGGLANIVEDLTPQLGGDLDCNGSQIQWSQGADVASGPALPLLTDGNYFDVTGTTTITSMNTTGGAGTLIKLHFDDIVTLTHHATNLVLAGGANIITAAGDEFEFIEYGAGTYRMTGWSLAGTAPGGGGGGGWLGEVASGGAGGDSGDIIRINEQTLNTSQTMVATDNGSATGPLSIASGVTFTISSGATFVVI
jgi:hypothetical protein